MAVERRVLVVRAPQLHLVARCDGDELQHPVVDEDHAARVRAELEPLLRPGAWSWSLES